MWTTPNALKHNIARLLFASGIEVPESKMCHRTEDETSIKVKIITKLPTQNRQIKTHAFAKKKTYNTFNFYSRAESYQVIVDVSKENCNHFCCVYYCNSAIESIIDDVAYS